MESCRVQTRPKRIETNEQRVPIAQICKKKKQKIQWLELYLPVEVGNFPSCVRSTG